MSKQMKKNDLVLVERTEFNELLGKKGEYVTDEVLMEYGIYENIVNSPEYIDNQDNRGIIPLTLKMLVKKEVPKKETIKK
jgi:hypothetical protein